MPKSKLPHEVRREIRGRNYSYRTEKPYTNWIIRFIRHSGTKHPSVISEKEITDFLNYLAVDRNVAASTQNQALCALVFLYDQVLELAMPFFKNLKRAKKPSRIPVVLTTKEIKDIFLRMNGLPLLICKLMYGAGMRVSEVLRLRVLDIDFGYNQIAVRNGKGRKDRYVLLPNTVVSELNQQLQKVKQLHLKDTARGYAATILPKALSNKYPGMEKRFAWRYSFPSKRILSDPRSGQHHRYHIPNTFVRRALKQAAKGLKARYDL